MKIFKTILKFIWEYIILSIWQLPQLILGFFVWLFASTKRVYRTTNSCKFYFMNNGRWGVSLSHFIILCPLHNNYVLLHEAGHKKQSKILGPLYLLLIGLPSGSFNLIDRFFHKKWTNAKRKYWYYHLPWEYGANKLSGIDVSKEGHWYTVDKNKF